MFGGPLLASVLGVVVLAGLLLLCFLGGRGGMGALIESVSSVLELFAYDMVAWLSPARANAWMERRVASGRRHLFRPSTVPHRVLVVVCHPCMEDSRSGRAYRTAVDTAAAHSLDLDVVDLYADGFAPCLTTAEYHQSKKDSRGSVSDEVKQLQARVEAAQNIVFIYPVWWYNMPAMLKGFMDRVFISGFAYKMHPFSAAVALMVNIMSFVPIARYIMQLYSAHGLLRDKRVLICRSFGGPAAGRRFFSTSQCLEENILRFCGVANITTNELYCVDKRSEYTVASEERWLEAVQTTLAGWARLRDVDVAANATVGAVGGGAGRPPPATAPGSNPARYV